MVSGRQALAALAGWLVNTGVVLAQDDSEMIVFEQLTPLARAKVVLLLLFVIILGVGLILFAWLWGRMTRRALRRTGDHQRPSPSTDDWATSPLTGTANHQNLDGAVSQPPPPDEGNR